MRENETNRDEAHQNDFAMGPPLGDLEKLDREMI
jgi:hypothetical protein